MPDQGFRSSIPFLEPEQALAEGIVAVGGRLDVGTLYEAYRRGIFPWPQEGLPMLWFSPPERGVLFFDELHIPRRAKELLKTKDLYRFTQNQALPQVLEFCQQQPRPGQDGTWILDEMIEAYQNFHQAGFVRSFEVWQGKELVGGLYGVFLHGVFSGESMFHRQTDGSKRALLYAIEILQNEGLHWIDTQMVTPVVGAFGGRLIPRPEYLKMLKDAQDQWRQRTAKV